MLRSPDGTAVPTAVAGPGSLLPRSRAVPCRGVLGCAKEGGKWEQDPHLAGGAPGFAVAGSMESR